MLRAHLKLILLDERPRGDDRLPQERVPVSVRPTSVQTYIEFILDFDSLPLRLGHIFLSVVFFIEHDSRESGVDPPGPFVETGELLFAFTVEQVAVDGHHRFRQRVTQLKGKHRHFEKFSFRLLPLRGRLPFRRRRAAIRCVVLTRGACEGHRIEVWLAQSHHFRFRRWLHGYAEIGVLCRV